MQLDGPPVDSSYQRLVDEYRAHVDALNTAAPGELSLCWTFGDLEWSPNNFGSIEHFFARADRDPAFTVKGRTRWVAFARISGEIRYYAAALPQCAGDTWYWSGTDPERTAAVDAESDYYELGILTSVAGAVRLTIEYLGGTPLENISVQRQLWSRAGWPCRTATT